jgi:hypothetical protein
MQPKLYIRAGSATTIYEVAQPAAAGTDRSTPGVPAGDREGLRHIGLPPGNRGRGYPLQFRALFVVHVSAVK